MQNYLSKNIHFAMVWRSRF